MKSVYLTIGISGSGKSKLYNRYKNDCVLLDLDLIRLEVRGDFAVDSDAEVFDIFYKKLNQYLSEGKNIYISEALINYNILEEIALVCFRQGYHLNFVILKDSLDWNLCWSRVHNDILTGVKRSETSEYFRPSGLPIIEDQSIVFRKLLGSDEYINLKKRVNATELIF